MTSKKKRITDILGYLQAEVPDAQVTEEGQDDDDEPATPPAHVAGSYLKPKKKKPVL